MAGSSTQSDAVGSDFEKTAAPLPPDLEAGAQIPNSADDTADETTATKDDGLERAVNTVDWDGPDDPENPLNWPDSKKWLNILVLSILTIITPLGSSMFAPGIPGIMVQFHSSSSTTATFILSVYILGFAFGPLLVAPLSEIYGRAPLYKYGNILFTIFTICTALSNSIGMLMAFRFLMGLAGSVPVTIGSGTIADMMPVEKRGTAMSAWALGPLLGPCIGPLAGGYLIQAAGWRWVYWLVAIMGGVFIVVSFIALRETYTPILLEKKAQRLRKETGNPALRSKFADQINLKMQLKIATVRPLKLLFLTPLITLMALYVAVVYGVLYLLISTFSFVYAEKYGFDEGTVGLTFLPAGIGMMFGVVVFGQLTDYMVRRNQAKKIAHKPERRITPALTIPCGLTLPAGLFLYGWTTEKGVHWIVPTASLYSVLG